MEYSRQELMAIVTGREIRDGELAIFGVGLSMLAGFFAKACHAPNVRAITEGGIYGATPVGVPLGIECNRLCTNAESFTNGLDALGFLVGSGRCDVGIIGAAQVDRHGNVNTTGIWAEGAAGVTQGPPTTRLTGSGGANDIACGCQRFLIMVGHERKRFVKRLDYLSSPGYLEGGDARQRWGFAGRGPSAIITTLGVLRPDPTTKEFRLAGYYPTVDPEEIRAATGWPLAFADDLQPVSPPSERELAALRSVDTTGMLRRQ
ncbi:MAG: CoA-transferase subunit beta [Candidatus Competibacterales bacterium]